MGTMIEEDSRIEQILHKVLNKVFKHRDIVIDGDLYLRRWYITPRSLPIRLFLHCIRRPDEQRALHDHPWSFGSFVLARGYHEMYLAGENTEAITATGPAGTPVRFQEKRRNDGIRVDDWRTFSFRIVPAEHAHAVNPIRGPAWTLVFAGQAHRIWGFHAPEGWVDWRTYLGLQGVKDHEEDV